MTVTTTKIVKTKKNKKRTSRKKRAITGPFKFYVLNDPFPPRMKKTLTFAEVMTHASGASGVMGTERVYVLNGLGTPILGVSGRQPYGYDTIQTMYNRYKVNKATIEVTMSDPNSDGLVGAFQVQPPSGVFVLVGASVQQLETQPMTIVRYINNTGSQKVRFKQVFPMHAVIGLKKSQYDNELEEYSASTAGNTNPADQVYFRVAVGGLRTSIGTTENMVIRVQITYHVEFFERKVLPPST